MGHGHVTPNADGSKARCGGPGMCPACAVEAGQLKRVSDDLPVYRPAVEKAPGLTEKQWAALSVPSVQYLGIMRYFEFEHLPPHLQSVSRIVYAMAYAVAEELDGAHELEPGLRKLLEAKDCFVRAAVEKAAKEKSTNA